MKMLQDLGHPAPPSKQFIHCPRVFYRKFDMNTPGNEAIVAKYGYDLDQNHHEVNVKDSNEICQVDDKFSQNFMNALLISICECLTYSQYITQTHHLGKPLGMASWILMCSLFGMMSHFKIYRTLMMISALLCLF